MFRFRKSRLPLPAVGLLIFAIVMGAALIWQLFVFVTEPGGVDWLLVGLFIATIALFVAMGLAVFFLDFEQRLVLLREIGAAVVTADFPLNELKACLAAAA